MQLARRMCGSGGRTIYFPAHWRHSCCKGDFCKVKRARDERGFGECHPHASIRNEFAQLVRPSTSKSTDDMDMDTETKELIRQINMAVDMGIFDRDTYAKDIVAMKGQLDKNWS